MSYEDRTVFIGEFPHWQPPAPRRRPKHPRWWSLGPTGTLLLHPDFAGRLLDPRFADMLRRARADGVGLPILVTQNGRFVDGRVNVLGSLSD